MISQINEVPKIVIHLIHWSVVKSIATHGRRPYKHFDIESRSSSLAILPVLEFRFWGDHEKFYCIRYGLYIVKYHEARITESSNVSHFASILEQGLKRCKMIAKFLSYTNVELWNELLYTLATWVRHPMKKWKDFVKFFGPLVPHGKEWRWRPSIIICL